MSVGFSLFVVVILILLALGGVGGAGLNFLFGIILPYAAFAVFLVGFVYRIVRWARAPVPFRIPTTCGQQKSLPWIKSNFFDNPYNAAGVHLLS